MPIFNKRWGVAMNELRSALKHKKPNQVKDAASLNSLLNLLNDNRVTGAVVPKGEIVNPVPVESPGATEPVKAAPIVERAPAIAPAPQSPAASQGSVAPVSLNKIAFTGRLMSGKDYVSEQAGLKVFSMASPLYALQKFFFGTDDKTLPGARTFLQQAGQIGRGEISAAYPLSIERANFIRLVRDISKELPADLQVSWKLFGNSPDLWIDAMLNRVNTYLETNPTGKVAITNVRFANEMQRLTAEGFVHRHVLCSSSTWTARLKTVGLTPESPACKDFSEHLAAALDADVTRKISQQKNGAKLAAIWSDSVPTPSSRLLTIAEFVNQFSK